MLWERGIAETADAKAAHADAVQQATRSAGIGTAPALVSEIPFHDPGDATRQQARELLNRARVQLAEAGDRAEGTVAGSRDLAPPEPRWWQKAWTQLSEYRAGVYEASLDLAAFTWSVSAVRMVADPGGYAQTVAALAQGARYAVQHPVETVKAAVDWETWQTNPARALGRLAPDLALTIASGGSGAAIRGARAVKTIDTVGQAGRRTTGLPSTGGGIGSLAGIGQVHRVLPSLPGTSRPVPGGFSRHTGSVRGVDFGPTGQHHTDPPRTGSDPGSDVSADPTRSPRHDPARNQPWLEFPDDGFDTSIWDRSPRDVPSPAGHADPGSEPTSPDTPTDAVDPADAADAADRSARDPARPNLPDRNPAEDYSRSDFVTGPDDHQAYRDRFGPSTDIEQRMLAEWRRDHPQVARLADEELLALQRHTLDHHAVNQALRTGDLPQLRELDVQIREAVSGLHRLPDWQGTVYRGIDIDQQHLADFLDRYRSGSDIREPGFTSTDTITPFSGNVQFVIESATGKWLPRPTDLPFGLREVLFPPGHPFHVTTVEINPHTQKTVINLRDLGR